MNILEILLLIVAPVLPIFIGFKYSIAPMGGPLSLIGLQILLGASIKYVYLSYRPDLYNQYAWLSRTEDSLKLGIIYLVCFSILVSIGYFYGISKEKRSERKKHKKKEFKILNLNQKKAVLALTIAIFIFILVTYLYIGKRGLSGSIINILIDSNRAKVDKLDSSSDFGSTNSLITIFYTIPKVYFFVFYSNLMKGNKSSIVKIGSSITAPFILFSSMLRGKRDDLISSFFSIIIITLLSKQKLSTKDLKFFVFFVFSAVFIFGFITFTRGNNDVYNNYGVNYLDLILEPILSLTYFTDINILSTIIERMGSNIPHLYGSSYFSLLLGLIPRSLWPDKPAISIGLFVKSDVLNLPGTLGGIPPTMPGEAYMNFGWLGLFIPFIYGFYLRFFETKVLNNKVLEDNGLNIYIYSIWIVPLAWSLMQSSFSVVLVSLVASLSIGFSSLFIIKKI